MKTSSEIFIALGIALDFNQLQWHEFASQVSEPTQQISINEILQDWMIVLIMEKLNYVIWCWDV